jgi:hypothetical protein
MLTSPDSPESSPSRPGPDDRADGAEAAEPLAPAADQATISPPADGGTASDSPAASAAPPRGIGDTMRIPRTVANQTFRAAAAEAEAARREAVRVEASRADAARLEAERVEAAWTGRPRPRRRAEPVRGPIGRFLRALDRRLLPPLGRALTGLGRGALWRRIVATVGAVTCVALMVLAVYTATRRSDTPVAPSPAYVGVRSGQSIPEYVKSAKKALGDAGVSVADANGRYALVSLTDYLTPAQLAAALAGMRVAMVFLRVDDPAVHADTIEAAVTVVPDDVLAAMQRRYVALRKEIGDLRLKIRMLPAGSNDGVALRAKYMREINAGNGESSEYAAPARCACAFAAVVFGSVADLQRIDDRRDVRVVDLIPAGPALDRDRFSPPLPEQKGIAHPSIILGPSDP